MNRDRAKQILALHRPGIDEPDAEVAEALALLRLDEDLQRWLTAHQAAQTTVQKSLRAMTVPAGLKEQIISERPWHSRPARTRHVLVVASVMLLLGLAGFWWMQRPPPEDRSFAAYRARMVSTAQRTYDMDLATDDQVRIRAFLKERGAPNDFTQPANLDKAASLGCVAMPWRDSKVAMICFKTGRALPPGQASDLWFFVIESAQVPDGPKSIEPEFLTLNAVTTASWNRNGKTYVLAVEGDAELLRRFL